MSKLRNKEQVEFDPLNPDHVLAIKETLETGRLSPSFRFHNEEPFTSAMTQAIHSMALAWMEQVAATKETLKIEETSSCHHIDHVLPGQRKASLHLCQAH